MTNCGAARALRRNINIAMWHDKIPVDHFGSGQGEMAERIRARVAIAGSVPRAAAANPIEDE